MNLKTALITSVFLLLGAQSASAATWPDAPYRVSGSAGTSTATANGTASDPVLNYSANYGTGSWVVSATTKTAHTQDVLWDFAGDHGQAGARVTIERFAIHLASETNVPLTDATPSGSFHYTGTTRFVLAAGDTYGFVITGANADVIPHLRGTLSLAAPLAVTTPADQTSGIGAPVNLPVAASGGFAPYSYSASGLPAGVAINPSTGVVSGTPTTEKLNALVTVRVTDARGNFAASSQLKWTVNPWALCANEGQTCTFTGTKQVRYGANGTFVYRTVTGSIACTNAAFGGDPAPNVVKRCELASSAADPVPAPVTGTVKWFDADTGYGFIAVDGRPDVFVNDSGILGDGYHSLQQGQRVAFDIVTGAQGPQAINVHTL